MKCACCGKRKTIFESFAPLNANLSVCIKCDTVLCRIKDSKKYGNKEEYDQNRLKVRQFIDKTQNKEFAAWFDEYLKRID